MRRLSRNPFYSGRFFHSWPEIHREGMMNSRNPFYSGRFFHSQNGTADRAGRNQKSQSLLFRAVFSLERGYTHVVGSGCVAIPSIQVGFFTLEARGMLDKWNRQGVAIPSIQVGFFTLQVGNRGGARQATKSQSLLFRSVFSLNFSLRC